MSNEDELALFLSDLFPKQAAEQHQVPFSSLIAGDSEQDAAGEKERDVVAMNAADTRIVITFKEKARYTEIARINKVQGRVLLSAVFTEDGRVTSIRVVQGAPDGLTRRAIEAAQKHSVSTCNQGWKGPECSSKPRIHFQSLLSRWPSRADECQKITAADIESRH
jgi:TonB family protein